MIAGQIKKYRTRKGYSQEQVARKLDVSQGAVSQWERGITVPALEQLIALADMFEVSTDDLLGRGSADNEELFALREQLRRDPNIRVLFSIAKKATPEHVKAAAAMLKALEPNQEGYFPDE